MLGVIIDMVLSGLKGITDNKHQDDFLPMEKVTQHNNDLWKLDNLMDFKGYYYVGKILNENWDGPVQVWRKEFFQFDKYGYKEFHPEHQIATYTGEWKGERFHGKGKLEGDFFNGIIDDILYIGFSFLLFSEYEGEFKEGLPCGEGTYYKKINGKKSVYYEGNIFEGLPSGKGKLNGTYESYEGTFKIQYNEHSRRSLYHGEGKYSSWKIRYEGQFKDGLYDGYGRFYYEDKLLYAGYWNKGLFFDIKNDFIIFPPFPRNQYTKIPIIRFNGNEFSKTSNDREKEEMDKNLSVFKNLNNSEGLDFINNQDKIFKEINGI